MDIYLEKQSVPCGMISRPARLICIDEVSGKLAIVRKSRTVGNHDYIEFHSLLSGWLAVPELVVCPENGSIENALFLPNGELVTCHANGSVCFLDPHNRLRLKRVQVSASTIWAACEHPNNLNKSTIALVSHSSILYFFDTLKKAITSSVSLGVESRLFDVASNGNVISIGSIDGIILVQDGKVRQTLKLDRHTRRDPTIAWTVKFLKNTILACGDSRGIVTLWDPQQGYLIQSITCLQSHVLTMCVASGMLHVSGVDSRIVSIKEALRGSFEIVNRRSGPARDVRSMAVYDNTVYAAGEDFDIYVCHNGCRKLIIQQQKNVMVAHDVVCSAGENFIDIWWKQKGEDHTLESNTLQQHYEMIFMAKLFSPKKRIITSWTLSHSGEHVVIGTSHETSVYQLCPTESHLNKKVIKLRVLDVVSTFSCILNDRLYVSSGDFEIFEIGLTNESDSLEIVAKQNDCGSITNMCVSQCGKFLCVLTTRSQVFSVNVISGESRLVKVELPIDLTSAMSSFYILTAQPAFSENSDTKKILHEVGLANGVVKRSASSHQLRMVPTSPKSLLPGQPTCIYSFERSKVIVVSHDGHWTVVDLDCGVLVSATDGPLKAKKCGDHNSKLVITAVRAGWRGEIEPRKNAMHNDELQSMNSRIITLQLCEDHLPATSGFNLKKFGMQ